MSTTYELMAMIDHLSDRLRAAERRLATLEGRVSSSLQPAGSPSPAGKVGGDSSPAGAEEQDR